MTVLFEGIGERLQDIFRQLARGGKLSEAEIDDALRQVRIALLEADVSFAVAKAFIQDVRDRCREAKVEESLTPAQTVVKLVHAALIDLLGGRSAPLLTAGGPGRTVMLVGLQGSGKTSFAQKLALHLKEAGQRPLLVAADLRRPAAVQQLKTLGDAVGVSVFDLPGERDPMRVAREGLTTARARGFDPVIVDTSGRTEVDEELLLELQGLKSQLGSPRILLVADAMTGQAAIAIARTFDERVGIDGIALTKMDGDARGGAALSMRSATGKPILFVAAGERAQALEPFHPDRMASRILGMGDVLTLIERAGAAVDRQKAEAMERKLKDADITLDDFLDQMGALRKMGSLQDVLGMIPGMQKLRKKGLDVDEREMRRVEAIVLSMTREERRRPAVIDASRRRRIARGSGTSVQDVNRLLRQFEDMKKVLKLAGGRRPRGKIPPGLMAPVPAAAKRPRRHGSP